MRCGGQYLVAEAREHVARVDHDLLGIVGHRDPAAATPDLETGSGGAAQQGDEIDVFMRRGTPGTLRRALDRGIVDGAQHGIAAFEQA